MRSGLLYGFQRNRILSCNVLNSESRSLTSWGTKGYVPVPYKTAVLVGGGDMALPPIFAREKGDDWDQIGGYRLQNLLHIIDSPHHSIATPWPTITTWSITDVATCLWKDGRHYLLNHPLLSLGVGVVSEVPQSRSTSRQARGLGLYKYSKFI